MDWVLTWGRAEPRGGGHRRLLEESGVPATGIPCRTPRPRESTEQERGCTLVVLLSILDAVDGSTRGTLMPIAVRGGTVECSSGVRFGFNDDVGMFAVYGIIERMGGTGGNFR